MRRAAPLTLASSRRTLNPRTPKGDTMAETRTVVHEDGDHRHIAVITRTPDSDALTDEEVIGRLKQWRARRHLRVVDGE